MTNLPRRVGERYLCFVVVRAERGWGGPYGQHWQGALWECVECGFQLAEHFTGLDRRRAAEHHECGHAPCDRCGQMLLRRKDGTPRQHAHNRCPAKTPGHKIEREYVKNMSEREYV